MKQEFELLRQDEAKLCLSSVDGDLMLSQLMNLAYYHVVKLYTSGEKILACDSDLSFFMEVMKKVFSDKEYIRRVLNGEDLRWFSDDE